MHTDISAAVIFFCFSKNDQTVLDNLHPARALLHAQDLELCIYVFSQNASLCSKLLKRVVSWNVASEVDLHSDQIWSNEIAHRCAFQASTGTTLNVRCGTNTVQLSFIELSMAWKLLELKRNRVYLPRIYLTIDDISSYNMIRGDYWLPQQQLHTVKSELFSWLKLISEVMICICYSKYTTTGSI